MNKKIISSIIMLSIIFSIYNTSFAEEKNTLYEGYKKNVETYCINANFYTQEDKWNKYIYKYKEYQKYYPTVEELKNNSKIKAFLNQNDFALKAIKQIYRDTQNEIYKCWLISAQYKSMKLLENLTKADKTWTLKILIKNKIKPKIKRLKQINSQCKLPENNISISKKNILDQSTFELCKYSFYLDYLDSYYSKIDNILWIDETKLKWKTKKAYENISYNPDVIAGLKSQIQNNISSEKNHSYQIYKLAFTAYSEYQNNYPIHLALWLLKDNLIIYRENLYKAISPINQVVYKIIHAMSK